MLYDSPDAVLSISQIMNMILENRGDRHATMQDLVNGQVFTRWSINMQLEKQTSMLDDRLEQLVAIPTQRLHMSVVKGQTQLETATSNQLFDRLQNWITKSS